MPKTPEDVRAYNRAWRRAWRERGDNRARERTQIYAGRAQHPERHRAASKAYHQRHKAQCNAKSKAYSAAHLEEITVYHYNYYRQHINESKAYNKAYNLKNKEEKRRYNAQYREANKPRLLLKEQAYRLAHPEVGKEHTQRRRAQKAGAALNDLTHAQWLEIQAAQDYRCYYCHKRCKGRLTQDHIIPLSKGGSHTLHNVIGACSLCNSKKQAGPPPVPVQPLLLTIAPSRKKKAS
jgi:HNH endonuclease